MVLKALSYIIRIIAAAQKLHTGRQQNQSAAREEPFAVVADLNNVVVEPGSLVLQNRHGYDVAARTTSLSERLLRRHENVWDVLNPAGKYLLLADERQMQHNLQRVGIGSDDYQFGDGPVEGFRGFVGALLDLLEAGALPDQVVNHGGQFFVG